MLVSVFYVRIYIHVDISAYGRGENAGRRRNCFGMSYDRSYRSTVLLFTQSNGNAKVFSLEFTQKNYERALCTKEKMRDKYNWINACRTQVEYEKKCCVVR